MTGSESPVSSHEARQEADAGAVHDRVGDDGGDDLAAQRVRLRAPSSKPVRSDGGKYVDEVGVQVRVVGHVGVDERALQLELGVGEQHRELRRRHPESGRVPLLQHLRARERLERAVEPGGLLEPLHLPRVHPDELGRLDRRRSRARSPGPRCRPARGRRPRRSCRRAARRARRRRACPRRWRAAGGS